MTDLDIRLARIEDGLRRRITRLESILTHRRCSGQRRDRIAQERNSLVIELHDKRVAERSYNARLREAMEDPTGQDFDDFPFSE